MAKAATSSLLYLLFTILVTTLLSTSARPNDRRQLMWEYLDLIESGNYESAAQLWYEPSYIRGTKFGIKYDDISVKIDCASPIIRNYEMIKDHLLRPVSSMIRQSDTAYSTLIFSELINGELVEHAYYSYFDGDYYWLIFPQDYICRGWPIIESGYFRIHYEPTMRKYLNPTVLKLADNFVELMADSLKLKDEDLKLLKDKKIDYFFCESDDTMEKITGHRIKGTLDLGSNDIISAFFPHYHELIHLLINFKLRRLPLYTLPILREGIAVHYAGRWGKAPMALDGLALFVIDQKMVELDSLLTMNGFVENETADIAYPIVGLVSSFILNEIGIDRYLKLYRDLSGPFATVNAFTADQVQHMILEATGINIWQEFNDQFKAYYQQRGGAGALFQAGKKSNGSNIVEAESVKISNSDEWISFEFSAETGNFLFSKENVDDSMNSILFDDQYPDNVAPSDYRFGIRFDQNEAGLYDYASNHLIAKYIHSLAASEEYLKDGKVNIRFHKSLTGSIVPDEKNWKLLPK